jgi:hypothetical protein
METLTIYEAGMRSDSGKYAEFIKSTDRAKVEEYIEIMKQTRTDGFEILFLEKTYHLVCTTPQIVGI